MGMLFCLYSRSTSKELLLKVSKVYDWIKVSLLSAGKCIIFLASVIFLMHCFSCLEVPAGNSVVCLQVTAKPWHTDLFLLESVTREDPEYRRNIQETQILFLKALWFTSFPFIWKEQSLAALQSFVFIADRITPFSSVCMTHFYSPWTVSCFTCSGLPGLLSGKSSLKCLAELYFYI